MISMPHLYDAVGYQNVQPLLEISAYSNFMFYNIAMLWPIVFETLYSHVYFVLMYACSVSYPRFLGNNQILYL